MLAWDRRWVGAIVGTAILALVSLTHQLGVRTGRHSAMIDRTTPMRHMASGDLSEAEGDPLLHNGAWYARDP